MRDMPGLDELLGDTPIRAIVAIIGSPGDDSEGRLELRAWPDAGQIPPYVDIHRCFRRGEVINLCKEALASGPLNTRQLALRVMAAKGLIPATRCSPRPSRGAPFTRFASNADAGSLTGRKSIWEREFGRCRI
jgi:hypothetical protein